MRLNIVKSKNKIFYYALDAHRVGDKIVSTIAEKIGEHYDMLKQGISDPLQFAKNRIDELNKDRKDNKLSINETYDFTTKLDTISDYSKTTVKNIGWLYVHKIYNQLGLKDFFDSINGKAKYDLNAITEYFVANRFLFPGSKRDAFLNKEKLFNYPKFSLHDGYRSLTPLDKYNDELQKTLFEGTKNIINLDTEVLYYDCTNFYFECEEQDENLYNEDGDIIQWGFRRYGACKEHRPNPIVQMGLFTDKNGIPMSYCVHHGSNNEQNTVIPLESRMIREYHTSKFIYCSDGGLGSFDNRFFNTLQNRDYVVTQSLKKTKEEELKLIFKDLNWKYLNPVKDSNNLNLKVSLMKFKEILDKKYKGETLTDNEELIISSDMLYKAFPIKRKIPLKFLKNFHMSGNVEIEETVYVTFSAKYYLYQKQLFERQIETAKDWIEHKDPENIKKGPNDIRRFIKTISSDENGIVIEDKTTVLDEEQIEYEKKFHGFYAIATSITNKSFKEILDINASRWKIEQSFRLLKTDFDTRPIYASTQEHIKGHLAICYIALLIYRILERQLYLLSDNKNLYSSNQILETIRNMNIVEISDGSILQSTYTGSNVLESLESIFNQDLNKKYYHVKKLTKKFK